MWAGVHFRSDVVAGQKIGEGVAEQVITFAVPPPAVGATLAFDWGLLGAKHYGARGSVVLSPELSEKGGRSARGESDCQPSM